MRSFAPSASTCSAVALCLGVFATTAFAAPLGQSDLRGQLITAKKFPNSIEEGLEPVMVESRVMDIEAASGFTALHPYILASPDQEDAGSCLYMSLTGITEWWLARLSPQESREANGPIDLSERFLMNLSGEDETSNPKIKNWKTDSIFLFNLAGGALLNTSYPFTKGWTVTNDKGNYERSQPNAKDASYGTQINWIDERSSVKDNLIKIPTFERKVVFADPESNQWNVGVAPDTIVQTVKDILMKDKAPVQVIYNHYGYWHSVFVVGFDDEQDNEQCKFVNGFRKYMKEESQKALDQASKTTDAAEKERLLKRAKKFSTNSDKVEISWAKAGGCSGKGVFHVRDSIYGAPTEPMYDYDPTQQGDEAPYSKKIVTHEYEWLRHLANHVVEIQPASR
jgi:hypothetical protein